MSQGTDYFLTKWHAGRKQKQSGTLLELGKLALFEDVEKMTGSVKELRSQGRKADRD